MTLMLVEGFEGGSVFTDFISQSSAQFTRDTRGVWSKGAMQFGSLASGVLAATATGSEFYFHIGFKVTSPAGLQDYITFRSPNDAQQLSLGLSAGGVLQFRRSTTVLGLGSTALSANTWYSLQGYVKVATGTSGRVQLKLDGVDEIHSGGSYITSINTQGDTATSTVDRIAFSRTGTLTVDDVIIQNTSGSQNNSWVGDRGVAVKRPMGVGSTSEWRVQTNTGDSYDTEVGTNGTAPYAWYKLDETSGTVADNAETTAARDGTYEGSIVIGTASDRTRIRSGDKYATFDGVDDDVSLPSGVLDISTATSEWSAEMWFRLDPASGNTTKALFAGRKSTSANPINALLIFEQSDTLGIRFQWDTRDDNGAGRNQLDVTATSINQNYLDAHDWRGCGHWHHIVVTRTSAKLKSIYYDGVLVGTGSDSMATGATSLDWAYIGRDRQRGSTSFIDGDISEFVVYRAALTAAEVKLHYAASAFHYEQVDDYQFRDDSGAFNVTYNGGEASPDDDFTDFDNSYIASDTTNAIELFDMSNIGSSYTAAYGIAVKALARRVDPGDRTMAFVVRSGGSNATSADLPLTTGGYRKLTKLYDVDPTDSSTWSSSKVNALEVGVKAT